ncbi:MAG TPA: 30S ribosomal protein S17 [Candidatus Bathyarchaeia archaeon]|jgi:small subunit ribosomal protein S17|nr:30S ribosomal protein S17 [Candidatus Bathyarchaeia archaeon]HKM79114.1 30S ribosomal protein S17 [Candidatus Bathyarchaeia archaeon]
MSEIGLEGKTPKKTCDDRNCPYHGELSVRRKFLDGEVVSAKMMRTVTVERNYLHYVKKYTRYEKRRSRIMAHSPPCLEIHEGDRVKIAECRPISKEVAFVVVEKLSVEA